MRHDYGPVDTYLLQITRCREFHYATYHLEHWDAQVGIIQVIGYHHMFGFT